MVKVFAEESEPAPARGPTASDNNDKNNSVLTRLEDLFGLSRYTKQGHCDAVRAVAISGDVDHVVSASDDGSLRLWAWNTEALAYCLACVLKHRPGSPAMTCAVCAHSSWTSAHFVVGGDAVGDFFILDFPMDQATYNFKPGEMGITYDDQGVVKDICPDSQALLRNAFGADRISKGDQIVKVGTEKYSKEAVINAEKSGTDYEVTFKVKDGAFTVERNNSLHEKKITGVCFLGHDVAHEIRASSELQDEMSLMSLTTEGKIDHQYVASCSLDKTAKISKICGRMAPYTMTTLQTLTHQSEVLHVRDLDPTKVVASLASCAKDALYLWSKDGRLLMRLLASEDTYFSGFGVTFDLVKHKDNTSAKFHDIIDAEETLIMGADANFLSVWVLDSLKDDLEDAVRSSTPKKPETPPPLVYYPTSKICDVEVSVDNKTYITLEHNAVAANSWQLAPAREEKALGSKPPESKLVKPEGLLILLELKHYSPISAMLLTQDAEDGSVLATGCEDGRIYIWDLEGHDSGEMTAQLRSLSFIDVFVPEMLLFVSFFQVLVFAFWPNIPWPKLVKGTAGIVVQIAFLDLPSLLSIEYGFWSRITVSLVIMPFFIICAFVNLPRLMESLAFNIKSKAMYNKSTEEDIKVTSVEFSTGENNSKRCMIFAYHVCSVVSNGVRLIMFLSSSVLVVVNWRMIAQSVDCVSNEDGSGRVLSSAPEITCFVGDHLILVIFVIPVSCIFGFCLVPYAVVKGDATYIQPSELIRPWKWRFNAERKATSIYLGPMHPRGKHVYSNALVELLVKISLPIVSTLCKSQPLLQTCIASAVAILWLVVTYWWPPLIQESYGKCIIAARLFIVIVMLCSVIAVICGEDSMVPVVVLSICSVFAILIFVWLACRLHIEHMNIQYLYADEARDVAIVPPPQAAHIFNGDMGIICDDDGTVSEVIG